ncbi:MAG: methyltransferase domain-containing protein [Flavobacterium sp.]|uniref:methyltransferase domain-containing protein n=1 Tax=Flavobacterium sp. TaxID=239 RepID=UPI003527DFB3
MKLNTTYRSTEDEIMDDFSLEGEELRQALDKIAKINQLLGGNKVILDGIKELLRDIPKKQQITIVDVGCGNGDMLRALAKFGNNKDLNLNLIGIDANQFTIDYAEKLSKEYKEINYRCEDVFKSDFEKLKYDIVLCTLTLHHFTEDKILDLLAVFTKKASVGIIINDLHRSKIAYRLFQLICFVFQLNTMSKEDGLTSILRGFKKEELHIYSKKMNFKAYSIHWKWAFRYQWIIRSMR